jgi:hypothetical protein
MIDRTYSGQTLWNYNAASDAIVPSRGQALGGSAFQTAVWTVLPCHAMSRSSPTLTESRRAISSFSGAQVIVGWDQFPWPVTRCTIDQIAPTCTPRFVRNCLSPA